MALCPGSLGHHTRPPHGHMQGHKEIPAGPHCVPQSPPLRTPGSLRCALDSTEPPASGVWGGRPCSRALDEEGCIYLTECCHCCHSGLVLSVRQKRAAEAQGRREGGYILSRTLPLQPPQGLLLTNSNQAACLVSTPTVLHTILAAPILKRINVPPFLFSWGEGGQHFPVLCSLPISPPEESVCPVSTRDQHTPPLPDTPDTLPDAPGTVGVFSSSLCHATQASRGGQRTGTWRPGLRGAWTGPSPLWDSL